MTEVTVNYHHEPDGSWWAESDVLPGFTAVGSTREEIRRLAREGAEFHLERTDIALDERYPQADLVEVTLAGFVSVAAHTANPSRTRNALRPSRLAVA